MLQTFHFLRPEWLLAIIPVSLLLLLSVKHSTRHNSWEKVCDPALLQYQLTRQHNNSTKSYHLLFRIVPIILLICIIALAGPAWEKKEQPVFQQDSALVIILDLSLSMNSKDIKPSRIERSKLKIIDILKQKKEGQTALIAFAGDAHTVSPLTIDNKTIMSLLPALETSIMPVTGSHISDAFLTAEQLLKNAGFTQGDILLITDGINANQKSNLKYQVQDLLQQGYTVSVIGVGSQAGSPIPVPGQGGFIKDASGQVVLSKLSSASLKSLAQSGGGSYHKLSLDDRDFEALLDRRNIGDNNIIEQDNQVEQWIDEGAYVTLFLLPFALLAFRKGLLSVSVFLVLSPSFFSEPVHANKDVEEINIPVKQKYVQTWNNLWSTPDQQGQQAFNNQDYQKSAAKFLDNNWKANAYYRSGEFDKAVEQYSRSDSADSLYNKANALANLKKFEEAIQTYEDALEINPQLNDAIKNRDYLKELLAKQKQQQSDQQKSDNSEASSDSQSKDQQQKKSEQNSQQNSAQNNPSEDNSEQNNSRQNSEQESNEDNDSKNNDSENNENNNISENNNSEHNENNTPEQQDGIQNKPEQDSESEQNKAEQSETLTPEQKAQQESQQKPTENNSEQRAQSETMQKQGEQQGIQNAPTDDVLSQLSQEEQQSLKQWLQRIPDNPGELLRIKFRNNSLLKQRRQDAPAQYEGNPW